MVKSAKTFLAEYSLDRIVALAKLQAVDKRSRNIDDDLIALNYNFADMCDCLALLKPCHYQHTHQYENRNFPVDVYKLPRFISAEGYEADITIYIKLSLDKNVSSIQLFSFHVG